MPFAVLFKEDNIGIQSLPENHSFFVDYGFFGLSKAVGSLKVADGAP
jgi:hypothetical protein